MGAPLELIQKLDSSISHSTDERRSVMLRHLTDLFLFGSDQYSEGEIDLIDDVFVRLVGTIEQSSRALLWLAAASRYEELVAALSAMSNVPTAIIEQNMRDSQAEALLVFAKAIGLYWETTRSIMVLAAKRHRRSTATVDQAMPAFHRLRQSTAQQILDFHRMSSRAARSH